MRDFDIIDAEQRSSAWFAARLGRLTGSVAGDMLATIKGGAPAASRTNLKLRLVLERLTGRPQEPGFVSPAMQDGIDREAGAFAAYEALTGEVVTRSGFLAHRTHLAGCSLDGHRDDFAKLLSIKCRQPAAHLAFLKSGTVPADALAQIRHECWVTGALEHDSFGWNPDFPDALQARLVTVHRADLDIDGYERAALAFLAEVEVELSALHTLSNTGAVLAAVVEA